MRAAAEAAAESFGVPAAAARPGGGRRAEGRCSARAAVPRRRRLRAADGVGGAGATACSRRRRQAPPRAPRAAPRRRGAVARSRARRPTLWQIGVRRRRLRRRERPVERVSMRPHRILRQPRQRRRRPLQRAHALRAREVPRLSPHRHLAPRAPHQHNTFEYPVTFSRRSRRGGAGGRGASAPNGAHRWRSRAVRASSRRTTRATRELVGEDIGRELGQFVEGLCGPQLEEDHRPSEGVARRVDADGEGERLGKVGGGEGRRPPPSQRRGGGSASRPRCMRSVGKDDCSRRSAATVPEYLSWRITYASSNSAGAERRSV